VLPESFRTKRQLKVGVRKVGYKKLNVMVERGQFEVDGEVRVASIEEVLVKEVADERGSGGGSSRQPDGDGSGGSDEGSGGDGGSDTPEGTPRTDEGGGTGEPTPNWAN